MKKKQLSIMTAGNNKEAKQEKKKTNKSQNTPPIKLNFNKQCFRSKAMETYKEKARISKSAISFVLLRRITNKQSKQNKCEENP